MLVVVNYSSIIDLLLESHIWIFISPDFFFILFPTLTYLFIHGCPIYLGSYFTILFDWLSLTSMVNNPKFLFSESMLAIMPSKDSWMFSDFQTCWQFLLLICLCVLCIMLHYLHIYIYIYWGFVVLLEYFRRREQRCGLLEKLWLFYMFYMFFMCFFDICIYIYIYH